MLNSNRFVETLCIWMFFQQVTHQLQYLPSADMIAVMKKGRIAHLGTYSDLVGQGVNFQELEHHSENSDFESEAESPVDPKVVLRIVIYMHDKVFVTELTPVEVTLFRV